MIKCSIVWSFGSFVLFQPEFWTLKIWVSNFPKSLEWKLSIGKLSQSTGSSEGSVSIGNFQSPNSEDHFGNKLPRMAFKIFNALLPISLWLICRQWVTNNDRKFQLIEIVYEQHQANESLPLALFQQAPRTLNSSNALLLLSLERKILESYL